MIEGGAKDSSKLRSRKSEKSSCKCSVRSRTCEKSSCKCSVRSRRCEESSSKCSVKSQSCKASLILVNTLEKRRTQRRIPCKAVWAISHQYRQSYPAKRHMLR